MGTSAALAVPVALIVPETTVCEVSTLYVPVPPVPETNPLILVPAVTPTPERVAPTARTPDATAVTVNVVPEIEPVTTAATPILALTVRDAICASCELATLFGATRDCHPAPPVSGLVALFSVRETQYRPLVTADSMHAPLG